MEQRLAVHTGVPPGTREVWLCLPGDAARDPWLHELLQGLAPGTRVVSWISDPSAATMLGPHLPSRAPLTRGLATTLARVGDGGVAYWVPVLGAVLERSAHGREIARRLRAGGLATVTVAHFDVLAETLVAATAISVAVLEAHGFRRDAMRSRERRALVVAAFRETGLGSTRAGGTLLGGALWALPRLPDRLVPLGLDAYVRAHFVKLGGQTRAQLDDLRQRAADRGVDPRCLDRIVAGLAPDQPTAATGRSSV